MPSFRGKIPDDQIWQLVAYVRSLSGHAPKDARARAATTTCMARPAENRTPRCRRPAATSP